MASKCEDCNGTGSYIELDYQTREETVKTCGSCRGSGER